MEKYYGLIHVAWAYGALGIFCILTGVVFLVWLIQVLNAVYCWCMKKDITYPPDAGDAPLIFIAFMVVAATWPVILIGAMFYGIAWCIREGIWWFFGEKKGLKKFYQDQFYAKQENNSKY